MDTASSTSSTDPHPNDPHPADGHRNEHHRTAPAMMSALVQSGYGRPGDVLDLAPVARPTVGPGEVLVRVRATTVNTPDWAAVLGEPWILRLQGGLRRPGTPIRGTDVAGVVEAVAPDVTRFAPGDEVFGSSWANSLRRGAGTMAEVAVVPADQLVAKPPSVSFEDAAASAMSGLTALSAVRDGGRVGPGTRILINGASGGVGTFAVQLARLRGGHVTAVCSGANTELVRSLGADEVIDYTAGPVTATDRRYDVILDNVLNHRPSVMARLLVDDGTLLPNSIGTGSRLLAGLPRMAAAMALRIRGVDVRAVTCVPAPDDLAELADLLATGRVRSVIDSVHRLADGAGAIERMLTHRARGNVVVVP